MRVLLRVMWAGVLLCGVFSVVGCGGASVETGDTVTENPEEMQSNQQMIEDMYKQKDASKSTP